MRSALVLTAVLSGFLFAGCVEAPTAQTAALPTGLVEAFYSYSYPGDSVAAVGLPFGGVFLLNHTGTGAAEALITVDPAPSSLSLATRDGVVAIEPNQTVPVLPGEPKLILMEHLFEAPGTINVTTTVSFLGPGTGTALERTMTTSTWERSVTVDASSRFVRPGHHVQTATVGLWINGTSFYTNIAELNSDLRFPAGYPETDFDATPLPIYVYNADGAEQPNGSRDTCHFTTITGYNELLKTQASGTTGVRYLEPTEAYTRDGAEDFFLYGHPLVFLNTIVAHDGATGPADAAPAPAGDCFDANRYSPVELPPVAAPVA